MAAVIQTEKTYLNLALLAKIKGFSYLLVQNVQGAFILEMLITERMTHNGAIAFGVKRPHKLSIVPFMAISNTPFTTTEIIIGKTI